MVSFQVVIICCLIIVRFTYSVDIPSVPLYNAAVEGTEMPVIGLGTGSYCGSGNSNISHPECWNISSASQATIDWFNLGGRRFDNADSYNAWQGVAAGLLQLSSNWTKVNRSEIFLVSKTGPWKLMGYQDTIDQWKNIINTFQTEYVDLLLIHWPYDNSSKSYQSSDPYCNANNSLYNVGLCIQDTWKAYEWIFNNGGAKAI